MNFEVFCFDYVDDSLQVVQKEYLNTYAEAFEFEQGEGKQYECGVKRTKCVAFNVVGEMIATIACIAIFLINKPIVSGFLTERRIEMTEELKSIQIPVKVGQKVFKICPKCNDRHNGSCKDCEWSGAIWHYCHIDVMVYDDGSFNEHKNQIVPMFVTEHNLFHIIDEWNITYFDNIKEIERAIKEYEQIIEITDRCERVKQFKEWCCKRKIKNELMINDEEI